MKLSLTSDDGSRLTSRRRNTGESAAYRRTLGTIQKKPTELHTTSVKTSSKKHFTDKLTQLLLIYSKKLVWNRFWHKEKDALSVRGEEHLNFILRND